MTKKEEIIIELDKNARREIIMQSILNKFIDRNMTVIPRYVVLNSLALFMYKDEIAY